jgi:hypothetical protein
MRDHAILTGKNMGDRIHVECGHCHKHRDFVLGVGHDVLVTGEGLGLRPRLGAVRCLTNSRGPSGPGDELCPPRVSLPGCHRLYETFHVRIEYDLDQFFATPNHCRKCSLPLESVSVEDIPSLTCDGCGEQALTA